MPVEKLTTNKEMSEIVEGDFLLCYWHRDIRDLRGNNKRRVSLHRVEIVKDDTNEIILDCKNNIYFNKKMFLDGGNSNLKELFKVILTDIGGN